MVVVNSVLKAGLEYQIHGQFHEWRDPITSRVYGLHFPEQEDAAMFLKTINSILNRLTNPDCKNVFDGENININSQSREYAQPFISNALDSSNNHATTPKDIHFRKPVRPAACNSPIADIFFAVVKIEVYNDLLVSGLRLRFFMG
ncbi:uncharacterized protein DC041_0007612 [Schistosoma bovis]|uniref:WH1 domain-containing protein n=1 Tax=Schistosoma bovis TaxID=6184 RepID=A0A430QEX0_SCHBO|nr:uncharacterized protein DC041_0007612 [Schistosoma bovis]